MFLPFLDIVQQQLIKRLSCVLAFRRIEPPQRVDYLTQPANFVLGVFSKDALSPLSTGLLATTPLREISPTLYFSVVPTTRAALAILNSST